MTTTEQPTSYLTIAGALIGAAALVLAIVHFVSGPFAPQPEMGQGFGELAAGMAKSAAREFVGLEQPAPRYVPKNLDDQLRAGTVVAAGAAILLGIFGVFRKESRFLGGAAMMLGSAAVMTQFIVGIVVFLACALVLAAFFFMLGEWSPFG